LIYGRQEPWQAICLGEDIGSFKAEWQEALLKIKNSGETEVIVVCDIPRGTPYNVSFEMAGKEEFRDLHLQVITGMSTGLVLGMADAWDDLAKGNVHPILENILEEAKEIIALSDTKAVLSKPNISADDDEL
jgi:mannose/fructose-specific phosphotransferase system component IIA